MEEKIANIDSKTYMGTSINFATRFSRIKVIYEP